MRIWLIGAGEAAIEVLQQLAKNPEIDVIVSAASEAPLAVRKGVIQRVHYIEQVNSFNVNTLARRVRPDLILIDSGEDRGLGRISGGAAMSAAMIEEVAVASDYPCLIL